MPDIDLELPDLGALKAEAHMAEVGVNGGAAAHVSAPEPAATVSEEPERLAVPAPVEPAAPQESTTAAPASEQREPYWVDASRASSIDASPGSGTGAAATEERSAPHFDPALDLRGGMALGTAAANAAGETGPVAAGSPAQAKPSRLTGLALVLLLLTLASLLVYAARGHIAQAWPELRPLVLQACANLGCELPALRQLDAVKVQGSSLSRDDASGHHRLRIQLLNTDQAPVLMPAFDLTLVDPQGEVLARRMIDPQELQPALTQLNPGAEAALSVTLDLRALDSASVSSFRLSAYYP
jgi:hypothetical protein